MNFNSCVEGLCRPLTYRWLIMIKLAILLTCGVLLDASANVFAQQITLKADHTPLFEVMKTVQHQSGYLYLFKGRELANTYVTADVKQADIQVALDKLLTENGLEWSINDKTIVIRASSNKASHNASASVRRQTTISGQVRDEDGNPLAGATVTVNGTDVATSTDESGNFQIVVDGAQRVLTVSILGFETKEVPLGDATTIQVTLSAVVSDLDEVIVIGYGTTTRKRVVGAVDQVDSKLIENRPVGNVTQALQGASPSLNIQQRSMNPNDNSLNINIRGVSTMNSNAPLIVIDGLVSESGSLNKLNPNDIESVSVLKDAGTSSIYGSHSSNVVILVTNTGGRKNQRPTLTLIGQFSDKDPKVLFSPVVGYQITTLTNLALPIVPVNTQFTSVKILDLPD